MSGLLLVAGVGNIFLGDDGFGVEVARRLAGDHLPSDVRVADFGIRGVHLAYELLDGYDQLILVDAVPHGEAPGTVSVIEPEMDTPEPEPDSPPMDAHGMDPATVFSLLHQMGGRLDRAVIVGCEPADTAEGIGLSSPVEGAVDDAVRTVRELVAGLRPPAAAGDGAPKVTRREP